jgi:hypothetical protein
MFQFFKNHPQGENIDYNKIIIIMIYDVCGCPGVYSRDRNVKKYSI